MRKNANTLLYLAILIPVLMIIAVAIASLYPKKYPHTKYNFIYVQYDDPNLRSCAYQIEKKLTTNMEPKKTTTPKNVEAPDCSKVKLYVYDVNTDTRSPITFEEAKKLRISNAYYSPDGYSVNSYCDVAPMFSTFGNPTPRSAMICLMNKERTYSKKLNMDHGNQFYDKEFIAWIIK